ncbi:hypothetical protein D3C80_872490 [compost metagenome]
MVDAGLAADRRVDLGQQGRRHLDEIHATLVASSGKPGHVADHPAAQGDHGGATVVAGSEQGIENQLQGFPVLERLAIRQHHRQYRIGTQGLAQTLEIKGRDSLIGDNGDLPAGNMRRQQFRLIQQAFANVDRVATFAQFDL